MRDLELIKPVFLTNSVRCFLWFFFAVYLLLPGNRISQAADDQPIVRAVLFYSPTCGHCEYVIVEILPSIFEKYADQLEMVGVDVSTPEGSYLFQAVLVHFGLDQGGVPFLVVGDQYLVGSVDIPEKFSGIIDDYLSQGGVDWPSVPEIQQAMNTQGEASASATATATAAPTATVAPTTAVHMQEEATPTVPIEPTATAEQPVAAMDRLDDSDGSLPVHHGQSSIKEKIARDPAGNTAAIVVLAGILASLLFIGIVLIRFPDKPGPRVPKWVVPVICLVGIVVAGYLAYVETNQVEAVCGPVGDCNTVQQSEFARLFGILPVGILGLVGYFLILCAWLVSSFGKKEVQSIASFILFGLVLIGTLFSLYLTFLEPFVIGASCAWCLTSAVLMTLLMWVTFPPTRLLIDVVHLLSFNKENK